MKCRESEQVGRYCSSYREEKHRFIQISCGEPTYAFSARVLRKGLRERLPKRLRKGLAHTEARVFNHWLIESTADPENA